ncbi:MAG: phosphoglucomutase, alpha-D-glucose phosphate-specific, partial [Calditrichia bacterium]|nr:phosphoglucomutase, alpha-D-glucose phosphate-specific [Calditrichia bacterium]
MPLHKLAGQPAPIEMLTNIPLLVSAYYYIKPNLEDFSNLVSFGTSGHRGSSLKGSFNERHIEAIAQAVCDVRKNNKITGPLFVGKDTHALSEPAFITALEVFAANGVNVRYQKGFGYTPTPVISHAILTFNRGKKSGLADGVVITPSHNPPPDGGFKYNPPNGGPADSSLTKIIEDRANEILKNGLSEVKKINFTKAIETGNIRAYDYIASYVNDLTNVIKMDIISKSGLKIGVDPMGGAGIDFWQ